MRNFARRNKRDAGLDAELGLVKFKSIDSWKHGQPKWRIVAHAGDEPHAGYSLPTGGVAKRRQHFAAFVSGAKI
jgi:hypothetical protein